MNDLGTAASEESEAQETIHYSQRPMGWDFTESPSSPIFLHPLQPFTIHKRQSAIIPSSSEFSPAATKRRRMMVAKFLIIAAIIY